MDITLIIIWLIIFAFWFLYKKLKKIYDDLENLGIPYEGAIETYKSWFKVLTMRTHYMYLINDQYNRFKGHPIISAFSLTNRVFMLRDVEIIKKITIKDFDAFVNRDASLNSDMDRLSGKVLFSLMDDEWRNMRSTLSPIFTSSKMKMMFGILSKEVDDFVTHYEEKVRETGSLVIDSKDTFLRFTTDGICAAVLGLERDCVKNENSEFFKFSRKIQKLDAWFTFKFFLYNIAPKIYVLLKLQLTRKEVYDFFYNAIIKVMKEREEKGIFRPDVIQLLLQAKKGQLETQDKEHEVNEAELSNFSANIEYDVKAKNKKLTHWTDEHYMAQGMIFFAAGLETTSITLQVTTYFLAKNKEVQKKLIEEVDEVVVSLNGTSVSYEAIHKMKYLDMVICEALRFWAPAHITRECNRNYLLRLEDGRTVKLQKGDLLSIPIYAIHHDERYFEDPEKFDPERFSDERKGSIVDGSYIPFGCGPRICIGSRFALMETKLLIFNILRKFTFEVCDKTPEKFELKANIAHFDLKSPIFLEIKLRS